MTNIYISSISADHEKIAPIARAMESNGWTVAWDLQKQPDLTHDTAQIAQATCVVVAWSSRSVSDAWVRVAARQGNARHCLVALQLDALTRPFGLESSKVIDFSNWSGAIDQAEWRALQTAIERIKPDPSLTPWRHSEPTDIVTNPYDFSTEYQKLLLKGPGAAELKQLSEEIKGLRKELPKDAALRKIQRQMKIAWDIVSNQPTSTRAKKEALKINQTQDYSRFWDALQHNPSKKDIRRLADELKDLANVDPTNAELKKLRLHIKRRWRRLHKPAVTKASAQSDADVTPARSDVATIDKRQEKPKQNTNESVETSLVPHIAETAESPTTGNSSTTETPENSYIAETPPENYTQDQSSNGERAVSTGTANGEAAVDTASSHLPTEPVENSAVIDSMTTLEAVEKVANEEAEKKAAEKPEIGSGINAEDGEQSDLLQAYEDPEFRAEPRKPVSKTSTKHSPEQQSAEQEEARVREYETTQSEEVQQNLEQIEKLYELETLNEPGGLEELDESEAISSLWELDSPEQLDEVEKTASSKHFEADSVLDTTSANLVKNAQESEAAIPPNGTAPPATHRVDEISPKTLEDPRTPEEKAPVKRWITLGTVVSLLMVAVPILVVAYMKYAPSSSVEPTPASYQTTGDGSPHAIQSTEPAKEQNEGKIPAVKNALPLPDMVNIPGGCATLGSHFLNEGPPREVCVPPFKMSRDEITFHFFDAFAQLAARALPDDQGWGRGNRPVINVSWFDAKAYADFVSAQTAQDCRLPSEAEWEYAARALTTTSRFWGKEPNDACQFANAADLTAGREHSDWLVHECNDGYLNTAPVATYRPNAFGLYDMLGNVSEWIEDCSHSSFEEGPEDSRPWMEENQGDCSKRVTRGGSWRNPPFRVRSSSRGKLDSDTRSDAVGFRVVCLPKT